MQLNMLLHGDLATVNNNIHSLGLHNLIDTTATSAKGFTENLNPIDP